MEALPRRKKGQGRRKNQTRQGNQNHGSRRRDWSTRRCLHATPHEVTLVQQTLAEIFVAEPLERLIGDNAYDSDRLDQDLAESGVEMIAPHRSNRKNRTQDGRALRRYSRRWKIERLFAWLQNYRRLAVRWEYRLDNFLGTLHFACALILMRHL